MITVTAGDLRGRRHKILTEVQHRKRLQDLPKWARSQPQNQPVEAKVSALHRNVWDNTRITVIYPWNTTFSCESLGTHNNPPNRLCRDYPRLAGQIPAESVFFQKTTISDQRYLAVDCKTVGISCESEAGTAKKSRSAKVIAPETEKVP